MNETISADRALLIAWGFFMQNQLFDEAVATVSLIRSYETKYSGNVTSSQADELILRVAQEVLEKKSVAQNLSSIGRLAECSFCGKSESEVKLGAGHDAMICNECVKKYSDIFNGRE